MKTLFTGIIFIVISGFYLNLKSQDSSCIDSIYQFSARNESYAGQFEEKIFSFKSDWEKGYVILKDGDTLKGEIKIHTDGIHIFIRNDALKEKLRADKYKSFKYGHHYFAAKKFDSYTFNVEIIESGPVSLYAYEQHSSYPGASNIDMVNFYLEKGSKVYGPLDLKFGSFIPNKSLIKDCFSDCPYLISKIANKSLKFSDLLSACQAYNCWVSNEQ